MTSERIEQAYSLAKERYAELGVDTDLALQRLAQIPISMHCWQGDDVGGFEGAEGEIGGGLVVTGNYPGRARTPDELRSDLDMALSLIPGTHRLNLHACYAETGGQPVERDQIEVKHFQGWIDWLKDRNMGMDFNPTCFAHPKADDGMTLSHSDPAIRKFWIDHAIACRHIGAAAGAALGTPCVTNVWIPDGSKDLLVDRASPRERLMTALDEVFVEQFDPACLLDAVETKLFGIGSESYVVGSHEFYMGYALSRKKIPCIDAGHFHPTESIADKIPALMLFCERLLLHVSRGVRWDSDHVLLLTDEVYAIAQELVRGDYLDRVHIALDYFDATINRVAAYVIGMRAMIKALLSSLLEPIQQLRTLENDGDLTARLAMLEELKSLPTGAIWDYYCMTSEIPVGPVWMEEVKRYETQVLSKRT